MADLKSLKLTTASDAGIGGDLTGITDNATEAAIVISSDEEVTMPLQPAFLAYANSTVSDVTGAATVATIGFNIEVYDQGGNFATPTFTAPITGRYFLTSTLYWGGMTAAGDFAEIKFVTSNRSYCQTIADENDMSPWESITITVVADLDASDTVSVTFRVHTEASDVIDIVGTADVRTSFSGCLLA